jgi:hypothetical protein
VPSDVHSNVVCSTLPRHPVPKVGGVHLIQDTRYRLHCSIRHSERRAKNLITGMVSLLIGKRYVIVCVHTRQGIHINRKGGEGRPTLNHHRQCEWYVIATWNVHPRHPCAARIHRRRRKFVCYVDWYVHSNVGCSSSSSPGLTRDLRPFK